MSGGGGKKKSGFQITSVTSDYEQPREGPPGGVGEEEGPEGAEAAAAPRNGPSAAPGSPGAAHGPGSRFRVVKLDQGAGEPYRRGRWTCRDSYDQEPDPQRSVGRLAEAAGRLPQSLDSRLEAAGLRAQPPGPFSPRAPRRGPALQAQLVLPPSPGAAGPQARSLGGGLPLLLLRPQRTPPSSGPQAGEGAKEAGDRAPPGTIPTLVVEAEPPRPRNITQLIPRGAEEQRKVLPREARSRSSSPGPPHFRDASPGRRTSDPFGAARFSLARSMFGMGVAHDTDDDSGTNSSMVAIDNKIEQAMDLVKSHLMFAVREEVEVLREQIKELSDRNALLEQENALLRSLASSEQLTRFQAQLQAAKPSPSGTA